MDAKVIQWDNNTRWDVAMDQAFANFTVSTDERGLRSAAKFLDPATGNVPAAGSAFLMIDGEGRGTRHAERKYCQNARMVCSAAASGSGQGRASAEAKPL